LSPWPEGRGVCRGSAGGWWGRTAGAGDQMVELNSPRGHGPLNTNTCE
jgi:hypothetical protein